MKTNKMVIAALLALALSVPCIGKDAQPEQLQNVTIKTSQATSASLQSQMATFQIHITGSGTAPLLVLAKPKMLFAASVTVQSARPGANYNGSGADSPRRTFVVPTSSPAGYSIPDRRDPNSDIMQVSCADGGVVTLRFWFSTGDKAHDYADTILVTVSTQAPAANCILDGQIAYLTQ